jgi:signal peptidase I
MISFLKENKLLLLALMIAFIAVFVLNTTNVDGISMENTFHDKDKLITDIFTRNYNRQDIVILFEDNKGQGFVVPNLINTLFQVSSLNRMLYVKRIIGLPGESIEMKDKNIIIYNTENPQGLVLKESYAKNDWLCTTYGSTSKSGNSTDFAKQVIKNDSFFVMGDNRGCSKDSRIIGQIKKDSILGKVIYRFKKN